MPKKIFDLSGIITIDGLQGAVKGLKDLGTQFQQTEKAFYKFGRQVGSAGSKLTSSITLPIIAVAGAVTLAAKSFGDYGDKIMDMSKSSGLSTDSIQELKQVASDAGTEFNDFYEVIFNVTRSMPQLIKGGGEISKTLRNLGVNVFDSNGKFRDMNILFPEIIKKLQNVKNETDRTALAQTIFGKRFEGVLDVINMTNDEFDKSRQKAHDLGLVMGGEGLKAADDFRIAMNDATNQLVSMGRSALLDLLPVFKDTLFPLFQNSIIPALKSMGEKVADVARWFNDLDSSTKKNILTFIGVAAAAGPVLMIFGKFVGGIAATSAAMKTLQVAFTTFSVFMGTNPLGLALIGIGLLTAAIIGVVSALDKIKKKKEEMAADKHYSASLDEERADNEKNIKIWQERLDWLKAQHNPTQVMIDEMNDLNQAIKDTNELLGKTEGGGVPIIDPDAEEKAKKALEAAKRLAEEREQLNKQSLDRIAAATLDHNELSKREEEAAVRYGTNVLKMNEYEINAIRTSFRLEREKTESEAQKKRDEYAQKEIDDRVALESEWTMKLVEQGGDRIALLEQERGIAIEEAKKKCVAVEQVNKFYDNERRKAEKELKQERIRDFQDTVNNYIGMIGEVGSGIASIFQQSTANKQIALDNQQQKERDAIQNSLMSEKEKRRALDALDVKQDKQQRDMRRKAAAESKKVSIFESIIGTAQAVVNALGAAMPPLNFIFAGIVGAIGAAKTALIAAQPLPLASGAIVKKRRGGIMAQLAEGAEDEAVIPLKTGVRAIAENLMSIMRESIAPMVPGPLAAAGAGSYPTQQNHWHIGVLVADDRGIKELERRQLPFRTQEAQRKGQTE